MLASSLKEDECKPLTVGDGFTDACTVACNFTAGFTGAGLSEVASHCSVVTFLHYSFAAASRWLHDGGGSGGVGSDGGGGESEG
jgi:hypothetical protein